MARCLGILSQKVCKSGITLRLGGTTLSRLHFPVFINFPIDVSAHAR